MRILALPCFLLLLIGSAVAQDTNFAAGPQYLLTGSPLLARSLATPTLSLDAPLPPVEPASFDIPEATAEGASEATAGVAFTTNPLLAHQADLIPIYYGVPNYYEVSAASVVEISFPEGAESSAALPASIVESGVTELVDGRIFLHKGVDIGDADHDLHVAVGQAFGDFNLIKITGSIVVDGRPQELAKVAHSSSGSDLRRMRPQLRQLRRHFRRKIRLKAVVDHDLFRGGLQVDVRRAGGVHELPGKRIAYEVHLG